MTPHFSNRSGFLKRLATLAAIAMISAGCGARSDADTGEREALRGTPESGHRPGAVPPLAPAAPEAALGVADKGIWPDLDNTIQIALPAGLTAEQVSARLDPLHHVLVLSIDGAPRKVVPARRSRPGSRSARGSSSSGPAIAPSWPASWSPSGSPPAHPPTTATATASPIRSTS